MIDNLYGLIFISMKSSGWGKQLLIYWLVIQEMRTFNDKFINNYGESNVFVIFTRRFKLSLLC